ncbi:hypothetical protein D3C72_1404190 [compost metagenome]
MSSDNHKTKILGDFLKSRRERIKPDHIEMIGRFGRRRGGSPGRLCIHGERAARFNGSTGSIRSRPGLSYSSSLDCESDDGLPGHKRAMTNYSSQPIL